MLCKIMTVLFFAQLVATIILWEDFSAKVNRFFQMTRGNMYGEDRAAMLQARRLLYKGFALVVLAIFCVLATGYLEGRADSDRYWRAEITIASESSKSSCRTIHRPLNGECPAGAKLYPGLFTERDGTKWDACLLPEGVSCIDELRSGESVSVTAPISAGPDCGGRHVDLPKPEGCQ